MSTEFLTELGTWIMFTALPAAPLFVLLYLRSSWRTTAPGRALMFQSFAISAIVLIFATTHLFGTDYPGRAVVRIIGYTLVSIAMWKMLWTLWTIQRGDPYVKNFPLRFKGRRKRRRSE